MGKILFWLLAALVAYVWFKSRGRAPKDQPPPSRDQSNGRAVPERMVKCATCGVFMPESDSVSTDGKISCMDPQHCAHRSAS